LEEIMTEAQRPRLVGINHVAIEVGNIEEALEWYGRIFDFTLRGKSERNAFIDMGDQFINMTLLPDHAAIGVEKRHVGLVVDDRSRISELAKAAGARFVEGPFLDFLDPWGNRLEIIEYANIQFTKAPHVMRGMGLALAKNDKAKQELADKGMAEAAEGQVTKGTVVPAGGGKHFDSPAPGRSFTLKLLGCQTGESIMMFEEILPPGTTSLHHLHHDSDEVAWVLAGEITFKIGDEVTVGGPGTCAFMPRDIPHAWKNTGSDTGRVLFLYTPAAAGGFIEAMSEGRPTDDEGWFRLYRRHRWEVVGSNPL
jgi:quercetin dioxygenase-like cupin family protein/catechol 2,3-dioxygenase-like lactoylglutathione lyase family enzyme